MGVMNINQDFSRRIFLQGTATLMTAPVFAQSTSAPSTGGDSTYPEPLGQIPRGGAFISIDRILRLSVEGRQVAGVVAVGATDKGIVYDGSFCSRDAAYGPAMSLDTVFWLPSVTKAVTATARMQFVEHDKLQLDRPKAN